MCDGKRIHDGLVDAYAAGYRAGVDGCARYVWLTAAALEKRGVDSVDTDELSYIARYMLQHMGEVADNLKDG